MFTFPLFRLISPIKSDWTSENDWAVILCFMIAFVLTIFWIQLNLILEKLEELKK